jgi:hypothetical protein
MVLGMRRLLALLVLVAPTVAACGSASTTPAPAAPPVQGMASFALVSSNVQGAAAPVEAWFAENGTYAGVTVEALRAQFDSTLPPIRIAWATAQAVCLESTVGGATASLVRPDGAVQNVPCQAAAG